MTVQQLNGELAARHFTADIHSNTAPNGHLSNGDSSVEVQATTEGHSAAMNGHIANGCHAADPDQPKTSPPGPIAICGMACRLPNGIREPKQLWEFLLAGNDARQKVPKSRYNVDAFYDPNGKPGTMKAQHGYFLDEDLAILDTSLFSMPRREVERADPQQRLMLEVARECFEDAGQAEWRGKRIGCYIGTLGEDWLEMLVQDTQNFGNYRLSGYGDFMMSNRISYEMNLQGPSMTLRTACSASMVALHEACGAIARGDCTSALVGGANLILRPSCTTAMSEQGVMSPDGSCKTFSAGANGYARGEAVVAVFLKPLEDAIRDRNPIRAVIRATVTNHDGKTPGISVPSSDAQQALIHRAYEVAGLEVPDTGYVECHGTGTSVGDLIETSAVARVFGEAGVTIGSTKPNLGHTEGASGILSVIKTVLMLENRTIPPSIKYTPRNPNIPWEAGKLILAEKPMPWPQGRLERASVNSFGLGGSNVHAIIDSAASHIAEPDDRLGEVTTQLLLYSANSQQSLTALTELYKTFIEEGTHNVQDIAYTLAHGREHLPYRAFAIYNGVQVGLASPTNKPSQQRPKIAMVFTGQGAQWPQMGSRLLETNSTFRSSIRYLDKALRDTLGEEAPAWSIEEELRKPGKRSRVGLAEFAQPLCTAIQIALVDTLREIGVEADAVVGHSSGEIAGAYAAGALDASEAIIAALYRGIVVQEQTRPGAMAALGIGHADASGFLVPNTTIACDNSPRSVTISGDADKVEEVIQAVRAANPDTLARKLQVDKAYHSYHMAEFGDSYHSRIAHRVIGKSPERLVFSSVEGKLLDNSTKLDARYWQMNLESPVLFNGAVSSLIQHFSDQDVILLEVGPHSALAGPLTQIMTEIPNSARYIPTIVRNQDSEENFLSAVGKLFSLHVPIDVNVLFPSGTCVANLPRYPYYYGESKHWFESRLSKDFRQRKYAHHDLLGNRVLESTDIEPSWRNVLHVDYGTSWLRDHKVGDDIIFPFAGYIAIAGEAVRQITEIDDAFRLRHISVGTAMLLSEEKPTEIITSLRPLRLTVSQDSSWYEFTVTAHNGHQWIKHCSGQVRVEGGSLALGSSPKPFARAVGVERWFDGVRREGLSLGSDFQNLEHITASTTTLEAQGTLTSKRHPVNPLSKYHVHPAVLDGALQLLSIAASNGLTRKHRNFLPVFCDQLLVSRTIEDFTVNVEMNNMGNTDNSSRTGKGRGVAGGKVVFKFDGLKVAPARITDDSAEHPDPHAASRLTWAPDANFVNPETLFQRSPDRQQYAQALDSLTQMTILRMQEQLASLDAQKPHLKKYAQWIETQVKMLNLTCDNRGTPSQSMEQLCESVVGTAAAPVAEILSAVASNVESLFSGSATSWESLVPSATITDFYDCMSRFDSSAFFGTLGHTKPTLRVLEIGNWTRSPSTAVLQSLTLPGGHNLWSSYTFAHKISIAPEERLDAYPNLDYVTLDIGEDLADQDFEDRDFDVVIANNVLHATPDLAKSLRNIKQLLNPTGHLFIQELTPASKWINVVLGSLPEWWQRRLDGRVDEPYVDANRWTDELQNAGFSAPEAIVPDAEGDAQVNSVVIARAQHAAPAETHKSVTLLVKDKSKTYSAEEVLQSQGYEVTRVTLKDTPQPNVDIISVVDLDGPFFETIDEEQYHDFQNFLANLKDSGMLWITRPCHIRVQDPRYALVIGLARVIRSELLIDFATCEIDHDEASFPLVGQVFEKFRTRTNEGPLGPEFEYAIEERTINVGRYYPFVMTDGFAQRTESERMKVAIGASGRLSVLHWARQPEPAPLKDDEVEVEIHAVGINFKDVLVAMHLIDHTGRYHGLEGAGVIRRVGAKVDEFRPGDRVALMEHNVLSTILITRQIACIKIPDWLNFIDAATMFTAYATVQQCLITVGRLRKGDSLLIHSACGGVGLAAIQIAQMIGAEIYATVGSEEKAQYLVKTFSIPRHRIFHSRDNSFVEGIFRETNGKGVDQVLNSLSGELLHETWKCVAPYGKLIEIGKRELAGHGRLDMEPFLANRSYCCVDIDTFYTDGQQHRYREMMTETLEYLTAGHIKPLPIAREFDASSVTDAIKYLLPGIHIGRVGIRIRNPDGQTTLNNDVVNYTRKLDLHPDNSYILVGGLGGLGRTISTYMVEHGARKLVYLGRSAGQSAGDQAFINELKSMGVAVTVVRGDVNELSDVSRAVAEAQHSLKGILQLTAVQADENFARLTKEQWNTSLGPKVAGTWNLHHATKDIKLDFFVLASSISAAIGLPGQSNYAAGNCFLDAFVQYRNSLGLTCSAVDIGPVADLGLMSGRSSSQSQTTALTGYKLVQEQELLDSIALSMMAGTPDNSAHGTTFFDPNVFVLGLESTIPLNSPANRTVWKRDRRMAIYHNDRKSGAAAGTTSSSNQLKSYIANARADPAILATPDAASFFAQEIGKRLLSLLLRDEADLNTNLALADLGLDSLVAIELRSWWKQAFGFDISVLEMLGMGNLEMLGEHAAQTLLHIIQEERKKE